MQPLSPTGFNNTTPERLTLLGPTNEHPSTSGGAISTFTLTSYTLLLIVMPRRLGDAGMTVSLVPITYDLPRVVEKSENGFSLIAVSLAADSLSINQLQEN